MGICSPQERWKDGKTTRLYMINSKGSKVGKKKKGTKPKTADRYNLGSISCNYVFTVVVGSLLTAHRSPLTVHCSLFIAHRCRWPRNFLSFSALIFFFFSFVNHMT